MKTIEKIKMDKEVKKLRQKIAELEKSEALCRQLENEKSKFLKIIENTQDAIFVLTLDGKIIYTNPAMDKLFGYKKGELIGNDPTVFNASPPNPKQFVKDTIEDLKKKGYWEGEVHNRRKDGSEFTSYVRICAFKNDRGEITNFLSTEYDVTEHNHIKSQLEKSVDKFQNILQETIQAIVLTIEKRDLFTAGHQRRVAELASAIAKAMNLSEDRVTGVYMAGLIHDIGKINRPAELLMKPAKLTEIEFKLIKNHPQVAYDILRGIEFPWPLAQIALQHHERLNGSGYPNGLKSEDIILESRILAVADVVEAMSSARPYRPALKIEEALEEISSKKGLLYDADVVNACVKLFKEKGFKFK
jgi:PAS domain S-box-containing protein/putative nucleotidyltransferase with HDIG domain